MASRFPAFFPRHMPVKPRKGGNLNVYIQRLPPTTLTPTTDPIDARFQGLTLATDPSDAGEASCPIVTAGGGEQAILHDMRGDLVSAVVGVGGQGRCRVCGDAGEQVTRIPGVVNVASVVTKGLALQKVWRFELGGTDQKLSLQNVWRELMRCYHARTDPVHVGWCRAVEALFLGLL
jgi:hypothetical protein